MYLCIPIILMLSILIDIVSGFTTTRNLSHLKSRSIRSASETVDQSIEETMLERDFSEPKPMDKRPHEQRVKRPRKARRMNHSFMHLYRHDSSLFDDQKIAPSSKSMTCDRTYLREYGGFKDDDIDNMSKYFPPLLDLDVKRHLRPKLRFIKHTLQETYDPTQQFSHENYPQTLSKEAKSIPPQYFGSRMEKVIAPRHAFLMYTGKYCLFV